MFGLACAVATAAPAAGQTPGWSVTTVGGVVLGTVSGDDVSGSETRTGVSLGAGLLYRINRMWAIQLGAGFETRGGKEVALRSGGDPFNLRTDYLAVPLLVHAAVPLGARLALEAHTGLAVGFSVGCFEAPEGGLRDPVDCGDASELSQLGEAGPVDVSWPVGAGLRIGVGSAMRPVELVAGARYAVGWTHAYRSASDTGDLRIRNRTLTPFLEVRIPLGARSAL